MPDVDLYFITGADALADIFTWHDAEELFGLANFVGCTRPGYTMDPATLTAIPSDRVTMVEIPALAISSTDCRDRKRRGEPVWYLVPDGVVQYIAKHRMDAIDRKILAVVQQDASLSVAEIGQRVGLSSTPCWKRLQRLEADGVITKRVALIAPEKIGLGITVFVSIETGDHSNEWLKKFADVVSAMPEVMEFYRMAGDVDYMLRVVVTDIAGYDAFYKKLIATVPLKNVTSRFAMERIKSTTALPISDAKAADKK